MKAVMMSVRPGWCEKIAQGRKTMELRKSKPKLELPFRCYIYCTIGCPTSAQYEWCDYEPYGMVIGEFVCDAILPISVSYSDTSNRIALREFPFTCLTDKQIMDYLGNGKTGYGWHISELVVYDKPKELSEFVKYCPTLEPCEYCDMYFELEDRCCNAIRRPPQSWCYVEELA